MGRLLILNALVLWLLGVASAQNLVSNGGRPIFPLNPNEGCTPGGTVTAQCPVRMECFKDENFPNGGRCDCNPIWFKIPAELPFDDSEWDDGFTTSDCENHHFSRFIVGMYFVVSITLTLAFLYTDFAIIRELIRVKALKWNMATSNSLFFLLWAAISVLCVDVIYLGNTWDADQNEFWYTSRTLFMVFGLMPANVVVDFEIGVTWIDLYDRTNKMSKNTSRALKLLKVVLRLIAFAMSFGFIIFVSFGGIMSLLISALMPSVIGMVFVAIGGQLIVRTLCPDKKDATNSNWKVAASIRRAVSQAVGAKFLEIVSLVGMGVTARHPQLGYIYGYFNALFFVAYTVRIWAWLHYLIYSFRKHLHKFADVDASPYLGFAVGLKSFTSSTKSEGSRRSGDKEEA